MAADPLTAALNLGGQLIDSTLGLLFKKLETKLSKE